MKARWVVCFWVLALPAIAGAQSFTREAEMTAGHSSESINVGGVQVRFFGPMSQNWRINLEGTWAAVSRQGSDAFGTAFPYDNRFRPMEAYVERLSSTGGRVFGFKAGQYRVPFGMYARSDHGYTGFTRAPLIRYGENWALSNVALEAGAAVLVGVPALSIETSVGVPVDSGEAPRPRTVDTVVRAQAFYRSFVIGASYLSTRAHAEGPWVTGRTSFAGVDGRWMRGGVQVRGEWITGHPFAYVATRGGYLDLIVHRIGMGPVTAVARAERLDYDAGAHSAYLRRYAVGARIRIRQYLALQVNALTQPGGFANGRRAAFDVGLTQTFRF